MASKKGALRKGGPGKAPGEGIPRRARIIRAAYFPFLILLALVAIASAAIYFLDIGDIAVYDGLPVLASFLAAVSVSAVLAFDVSLGGGVLSDDLLLLVGMLLWFLAEAAWFVYDAIFGVEVASGALPDLLWLSGYVFVISYLVRKLIALGGRSPGRIALVVLVPALLALVGCFAAAGAFRSAGDLSLADEATALLYVVADSAVLGLVLLFIFYIFSGELAAANVIFLLGFVLMTASDVAYYYYLALSGRYFSGSLADLGWIFGYLLVATAMAMTLRVISEPLLER